MRNPVLPLPPLATSTVSVIGLGYVGLPLAVEFAKSQPCSRSGVPLIRRVIGFDVNQQRLSELIAGYDCTNEITPNELQAAERLEFTTDAALLASADVFIVTVPTPIDSSKRPDLVPLERASATVGQALRSRSARGATTLPIVIYESTVFPGATEEVCVPILEKESGLVLNKGFVCGYSPERINPGDKQHRLTSIKKITSGSSTAAAKWVDDFYGSIIVAGTHKTKTIKVAEAAKVIENTQRDLNIALVNELSIIFRELQIDIFDVLEAAGTKWNFLPFRPGLVGGHCIGVDPYYLTHKAEQVGYNPEVVLAGRRINDGKARWVAQQLVIELARRGAVIAGARVLVLGLSFKEDCPDFRNTKVVDLITELRRFLMKPLIVDPWVDKDGVKRTYGLNVLETLPSRCEPFDAVILALAHHQFRLIPSDGWRELLSPGGVLVDLKGCIPRDLHALRL